VENDKEEMSGTEAFNHLCTGMKDLGFGLVLLIVFILMIGGLFK